MGRYGSCSSACPLPFSQRTSAECMPRRTLEQVLMNKRRVIAFVLVLACVVLVPSSTSHAQVSEPTGVTEADRGRPSALANEPVTTSQAPVVGAPQDRSGTDFSSAHRNAPTVAVTAENARPGRVALISAAVVVVAVVAYWLFLMLDRRS